MLNLYARLGLPSNATEAEIIECITKHQLDGTLDEQYLAAAKEWLLNSIHRKLYDEEYLGIAQLPAVKSTEIKCFNSHAKYDNKRIKKYGIIGVLVLMVCYFLWGEFAENISVKPKISPQQMISDAKESVNYRLVGADPLSFANIRLVKNYLNDDYVCGEIHSKNKLGESTVQTRFIYSPVSQSVDVLPDYTEENISLYAMKWNEDCEGWSKADIAYIKDKSRIIDAEILSLNQELVIYENLLTQGKEQKILQTRQYLEEQEKLRRDVNQEILTGGFRK